MSTNDRESRRDSEDAGADYDQSPGNETNVDTLVATSDSSELFARFLRYRFDFPAMLYDCIATFFSQGRALGRMCAGMAAALLIAAPAVVVIFGDDAFGDRWAFGVSLVIFPVLLEAPGRRFRQRHVGGSAPTGRDYDKFLFGFAFLLSIAAPFLLFAHVGSRQDVIRGILWAASFIGAQDLTRSAVAFSVAIADGRPLYV